MAESAHPVPCIVGGATHWPTVAAHDRTVYLIVPLPFLTAPFQIWDARAIGGLSVIIIPLYSKPVNWVMMNLARAQCIQPGECCGGKSGMNSCIQKCWGRFAEIGLNVCCVISVIVSVSTMFSMHESTLQPMINSHGERDVVDESHAGGMRGYI